MKLSLANAEFTYINKENGDRWIISMELPHYRIYHNGNLHTQANNHNLSVCGEAAALQLILNSTESITKTKPNEQKAPGSDR